MVEVKEIETERLLLRKLTLEDFDDFFELDSQESYRKFLPTEPTSREACATKLEKYIKKYSVETYFGLNWAVVLKSNNKMIGLVDIGMLSPKNKLFEIGWGINEKFQRRGYAFEASSALMDYIFLELGAHKIAVNVWEGNVASEGLAKRLGFTLEGIEREARLKDGKFLDVHRYGILENEWQNSKNAKK